MLNLFSRNVEDRASLDTRVEPHVRIVNASLDEDEGSSSSIVINGRIDPTTLRFLKVDSSYQRPLAERADIYNALLDGRVVPNIEIGVRGQDFVSDGDDIIIKSPAYIIDGWQRVGNALRLLDVIPGHSIRIFGSIHFGTDELWERHRFTELNKNVRRISPNLHLRNMRDGNEALLTLYGLSMADRSFPLFKKVSWSQNMQRGELISALTLALTAQSLHAHRIPNMGRSVEKVAGSLAKINATITLPTFRRNMSSLFGVMNECWPFAAIEYRATAPQVRQTFLMALTKMLSEHPVFWEHNDNTLIIGADDRRKLSKFPLGDPQIVQLSGTGGQGKTILLRLLVDHMNSGRRTQRLRDRTSAGD